MKLTDNYLYYKSHRMKPQEFEDFKLSYPPYKPHGEPFDIKG